jgi:hypothetical protein
MTFAGWRPKRLNVLCEERRYIELPDLVLIRLVIATGLTDEVFPSPDDRAGSHRDAAVARLRGMFRTLSAQLAAAVEDATLSRRA